MAYLFTYFTIKEKADLESVWFSVSKDGLHWTDIGTEEPVLRSKLGTKGVRDPFPIYDEKVKKYYIIATDLDTSAGDVWSYCKVHGSKSLLVWESDDLINWSEERLIEVGTENAGNVWAPEAIYCREKEQWLVFWASNVKDKWYQKRRQKIFASFTSDFKTFSEPFLFFERNTSVIDTTIIFHDGYYYRFSKDETNKFIICDRNKTLIETAENKYTPVPSKLFSEFYGLEGPEFLYLRERNKWCIIADNYHARSGYVPFIADDISKGEFTQLKKDEYDFGKQIKRHGGIIEILDETYDLLVNYYGIL